MRFIQPTQIADISKLQPGQFAFPSLEGVVPSAVPQRLSDTPRLRKTIQGMQTVLRNNGFVEAANAISGSGPLSERMEKLQREIVEAMRRFLREGRVEDLAGIFHRVQLWGGQTGRGIYVRGGGFEENFNLEAYHLFASVAAGEGLFPGKVEAMKSATERIGFFGVSFATKHARFWSEAGDAKPLPIFDSIIALGCLGRGVPHWSEYEGYVMELERLGKQTGWGIQQLERYAFAFFDSIEGKRWCEIRKRR